LVIYITDKNISLKKRFVGACYSLIIGNEAGYKKS